MLKALHILWYINRKNFLFSAYLRAVKAIFRSKNLSITFLSRNFVVPNGSVEISYEGANRGVQLIWEGFCGIAKVRQRESSATGLSVGNRDRYGRIRAAVIFRAKL